VTKESQYQAKLKKRLIGMFPGCIVMKNDANDIQGIPDLTVLWKNHWALLECKRESEACKRPNQQYYIDRAREMSFAAFIYPENEEETINGLRSLFQA
jgi:hypothetical protein